ncbi:unnamed protein product [Pseudo-nitzschia multistriata]|uniref:Uncharacterized protein n=1 Tax=Pseudo-nitzschia multistriata TaxID=183589 RepID=A0A448ZSY2_9STRA|nr:unnamed protein product [Pseudo-nitzschia multistriata]
MYSSCSCSMISVFRIGEKPRARIPKALRKRESVAAGKTCGETSHPISWSASQKAAYHGFKRGSVSVVA